MARGLFWSRSLEVPVPSGDYFDSNQADGIRVAGKVPLTYVGAASATTIKAADGGSGVIGDGVSATGSSASVTFNGAFTATPNVVASPDGTAGLVGSYVMMGGAATGSAVFYGVSGTGFNWIAYGDKY